MWCDNVLASLVYTRLSSFLAPLAEEAVFSPLCVLASFADNYLAVGGWLCVWRSALLGWSTGLFLCKDPSA